MREIITSINNGKETRYIKTESGTYYHEGTPERVIELLERYMHNGTRIRVFYGDSETGRDWNEKNDVMGTIGRSTGRIKIPLIINNSRSFGGPGLLGACIVKITVDKQTVYIHPLYHTGVFTVSGPELYRDGGLYARCKTEEKAHKLKQYILGHRNSR